MSRVYENATITEKANVYFDGKVTSRAVTKADGTKITLGFMTAGEYTFNTAAEELMEVVNGEMTVLLPGESEWKTYGADTKFSVPANDSFQVKVPAFADYCCSYIEK